MDTLFQFLVFALPFNSLPGPDFLGEMKRDLAIYPALLLGLAVAVRHASPAKPPFITPTYLAGIAALLFFVIMVGFAWNIGTIPESFMRNRSGINKFTSSFVLLILLWGFAFISANVIRSREQIEPLFIRPFIYVTLVCAVVSIPEVIAWFIPSVTPLYDIISFFYKLGEPVIGIVPFRLHAMSYEPPYLSSYASFALPWLLCGYRLASYKKDMQSMKVYKWSFLAMLLILFLSNSRTGLLVFSLWIVNEIFLVFIFTRKKVSPHIGAWIVGLYAFGFAVLAISAIVVHQGVLNYVLESGNISNVSRFASTLAAASIMLDNLFLGVGLGQYAFHALPYMPEWAFDSYEIHAWFFDPNSTWPPVFNLYARLGAEMGILGLLVWLSIWLWVVKATLRRGFQDYTETGNIPAVAFAIVASVIHLFANGMSMDTFRFVGIWIILGWLGAYLSSPSPASRNTD